MPFAATKMGLGIVILGEVSQTQKDKYCIIYSLYVESKKKVQINLFIKTEYFKPAGCHHTKVTSLTLSKLY